MRRLYSLFLVGILLIGCQDRMTYQKDSLEEEPITKAEGLSKASLIDKPYTFLSEKNSQIWTDVKCLYEHQIL